VTIRFLLCLAAWLALGPCPLRAAFVNGHSYVPVADWAQANGLKLAWLSRGEQLAVASHNLRAVFEVDSADALVNGVTVRLCFPIASTHGAPLISQLDADKTLRPFLYPPRYPAGRKITTICLDPGHGGRDTGNRVGSHNEKTYTLALAQELRQQLLAAGFHVFLTRNDDSYVDLPLRPALANQRGADLFVSLHFNATQSGAAEVSGPETYCITPVGASSSNAQGEGAGFGPTPANRNDLKSLVLAAQVQKSLVKNLGAADRGVRRARFAVLRDALMPAILIEGGYMTHPLEGSRIFDAGYRRLMARAIVQGIVAYQKVLQGFVPTTDRHVKHSLYPAKSTTIQ
jgi:N-acetylmuramoyl-L-alanine amidase